MAAILNTFQDQASAVWLTAGFNRVKIPWRDAENTIHLDLERFFRVVTLFGGIECIGVEFWHEIATQTGVEQCQLDSVKRFAKKYLPFLEAHFALSSNLGQQEAAVEEEDDSPAATLVKRRKRQTSAPVLLSAEHRLLPFVTHAPANLRVRLERAFSHRLYLISRRDMPDNTLEKVFSILGHTGNVYEIRIGARPSCTCPDGSHNHCKHLLFTLIKVLKLAPNSPLLYQNALLPSELQAIFASTNAVSSLVGSTSAVSVDDNLMAPQSVRNAFARMTGGNVDEEKSVVAPVVARKPFDQDDCAICFEAMKASENLTWCQTSCGKSFHSDCIGRLRLHATSVHTAVLCPLCRADMTPPVSAAAASLCSTNPSRRRGYYGRGGYTNLAEYNTNEDYSEGSEEIYGGYD